jgi:hypothetical protein
MPYAPSGTDMNKDSQIENPVFIGLFYFPMDILEFGFLQR